MPATETQKPLPPMHPWALHQMCMMLITARNREPIGTRFFITTPAALCGDLMAGNEGVVRRVLADFDWSRAIERELAPHWGRVQLNWNDADDALWVTVKEAE